MDGKLIILGSGASAGVPTIGNWWGACDPAEPKNRRTRPSIAIKTDKTLLIVDTSPDFREQMNRENLGCPDAIIITHTHSDHINGIDDLRAFQRLQQRTFPIYAMEETMPSLMKRADYLFKESENGFYQKVCEAKTVEPLKPLAIGDIMAVPFLQNHGTINSLGLRFGNIGYSTDMKWLSDGALAALGGIDTWIVDGAGYLSTANPVHTSIQEVVEMNRIIGAKKVILTHLTPAMDYHSLLTTLPPGFMPAHDGLCLKVTS